MQTLHTFDIKKINVFDGKWHTFKYFLYKPSFCGIRLKTFLDCKILQRTSIYTHGTDIDFNKKLLLDQLIFSIGHLTDDDNNNEMVPFDLKIMKFSKNLAESLHKCCLLKDVEQCNSNYNSLSHITSKSKRSKDVSNFVLADMSKNIEDLRIYDEFQYEKSKSGNSTGKNAEFFKKRPVPPVIIIIYFLFSFGLVLLLLLKRSN
ncbi:uncharacterized protein LOC129612107 [Condylostylus longicornis]|uniref:uncharacterized protein LOC129612107 n=1 Tax=Condylostylus longicornis TaxID=2530218 RepID=UPI00244E5A7B|nr:uncharacterized protein LOC129612107 [Condylostylus longicornis]